VWGIKLLDKPGVFVGFADNVLERVQLLALGMGDRIDQAASALTDLIDHLVTE
jgi:hypothetical protein